MRYRIAVLLTLVALVSAQAQVLRTINYNYIYRPSEDFTFTWKALVRDNKVEIMYALERNNTNVNLMEYDVLWEIRKDLSEKEGNPVKDILPDEPASDVKTGRVSLDKSLAGQVIVAKIASSAKKTVWLYYKTIPSTSEPYLVKDNRFLLKNYALLNETLTFEGFDSGQPLIFTYYNYSFPSAAPPFSSAQARVAPILKADSVFVLESVNRMVFSKKGLYLVQQDTASSVGVAFRIEDDYPKLGTIETLAGPLIYITTKQEHQKLLEAGNNKTAFDQVILSITGNAERARIFMRSYFRNVELANRYFSSYKEGWKTDRGMIYIIYGLPDAVYLLGDREVWEYKSNVFSGQFTFVRSASVFDPDNFVLIRDKGYQDKWYMMIDLWRKARF